MALKPMLFNTEMVRAILSGQKTCTRRVVKVPTEAKLVSIGAGLADFEWRQKMKNADIVLDKYKGVGFPYQPGDILYVRETWRIGAWRLDRQEIAVDFADGTIQREWIPIADKQKYDKYVRQSREDALKAGLDEPKWIPGEAPTRWRPSIHMPKEAARIFLRVTDVRVERLGEITEDDAKAEGASPAMGDELYKFGFARIWDSTIKPADLNRYGWAANPWVFVIEFERISKEAALGGESDGKN